MARKWWQRALGICPWGGRCDWVWNGSSEHPKETCRKCGTTRPCDDPWEQAEEVR